MKIYTRFPAICKNSRDEFITCIREQMDTGNIIHFKNLFRRYFSMLDPQEWQKTEKKEEFVGSFRLEYDRSWTPMIEANDRDRQFARFENVLRSGPSMLGWTN